MTDPRLRGTWTAYVAIEARNTWSNFVRAFYISLADGVRLESGTVATVSPTRLANDAIGFAVQRWRPSRRPQANGTWHRRDEPAWHDPNTILTLCRDLAASNTADVEAAFSAGSRVFLDLPVFRNYFAHRNQETRRAALDLAPSYGVPAPLSPAEILLARALGRPQPVLVDWIDDLTFTAEYLCS
jgi:hypothetical protein